MAGLTPDDLASLIMAKDLPAVAAALDADPSLVGRADATHGWTPLQTAAYHGCNGRGEPLRAMVDLLLARDPAPDLASAALLDRGDLARSALERGAAVNDADTGGRTPLHWAAERGSAEVAALLLAHGADPNARTLRGETALALAAHPGPLKARAADEVVALLRRHGARVDLHAAATLGDTTALAALLADDPAQIDGRDEHGATALFCAAHNLHLAAVDLLLNQGADVDLATSGGETALSAAVDHMWDEHGPHVVERLLAARPRVDLFSAAQLDLADRVDELLRDDPSLLAGRRYGYHCLFLAAGAGAAEAVSALLRHGAEADERDIHHGATALHQAAAWGRLEVARRLLAGGADASLTNRAGQTPAELARAHGWLPVAELLASPTHDG